jgi:hypothetical protein
MNRSYTPSQIADGILAGEITRDSAFVPLAEVERLRAERELQRELLKDPNAVTINMLRGVIALPSADQMRHIYQQTLEVKP